MTWRNPPLPTGRIVPPFRPAGTRGKSGKEGWAVDLMTLLFATAAGLYSLKAARDEWWEGHRASGVFLAVLGPVLPIAAWWIMRLGT
ncbi:hypothetical protein TR75_03660 [Hydrogenibacillus schlegelii]|uniref:Uncharacterized protein n=1 Tax=Hydrogenibacillus schlegelii TaxID=1484 RepID=A0A132NAL7_HYDSH|nr:hypothetical protein TR75_03660 [Hydrogenibacillus schlegelii]OAR03900.1 hypothetical protein SA87_03470 [Hydrogenibacillus schlegelii]